MNLKTALRWIWLLAIGWWLGIIVWLTGAALCLTIVGIPIGYYLMDRAYTVATLNID